MPKNVVNVYRTCVQEHVHTKGILPFIRQLEKITKWRIRLFPRVPREKYRRADWLAFFVSDAFVGGRRDIFWNSDFCPKEMLLHEVAHIESQKRFGCLIPCHRTLHAYSSDTVVRFRDSLVRNMISETVADAISFFWSKKYFDRMLEERCEYLIGKNCLVLCEEDIIHILAQIHLLKRLEKSHGLDYASVIATYAKTYGNTILLFMKYHKGVSKTINIIKGMVLEGVKVAFNIIKTNDRRKARGMLQKYVSLVEESFAGAQTVSKITVAG
jgi:hypothetical protein